MVFGSSVGYGEAKVKQGCCTKSLCLDILRLAILTKNTIDINKLDGALAFQIHAHLCFPQSLEDLPSLLTMVNIKKLLGIKHAFWTICKRSEHPDIIEEKYMPTLIQVKTALANVF
ncbi:hypothetical protein CLU79DRAFT_719231 [Phycomyces nitens]|nr:hypothetical protein CLU79DRAFT_719231 [Phycomyces nitens]